MYAVLLTNFFFMKENIGFRESSSDFINDLDILKNIGLLFKYSIRTQE